MKEAKCGCSIQLCSNHKCKATSDQLDAAGNHGLTCNPGVKAMRATILEKALEKSFRRTGGTPHTQPQTYDLLGKLLQKMIWQGCLVEGSTKRSPKSVRSW